MLYPFLFEPILKERIWGGRQLASLYGKSLGGQNPVGESWEISDRPGDVSVIVNGPLAGKDLRWLMEHHGRDLLGDAEPQAGRFPLLVKILDAQEKLSLQVHPPRENAASLKGEPKTEMWFITDAAPSAELYVGLRKGFSQKEFAERIEDGTVADCFHRVPVRKGDAMFLPSGRVHAIGAGLVIFEIQQNSDTTYRVFDWNRVGLDGKPRELHIPESMASIDFQDFEPGVVAAQPIRQGAFEQRDLVRDPLFEVKSWRTTTPGELLLPQDTMQIIGVAEGRLRVAGTPDVVLGPGQFCLVPASIDAAVKAEVGALFLTASAGKQVNR